MERGGRRKGRRKEGGAAVSMERRGYSTFSKQTKKTKKRNKQEKNKKRQD